MAYNREFWRERGRLPSAQQIVDNGIPVLLWSGWGDIVEIGALRAYTGLQNAYAKRPVYARQCIQNSPPRRATN